MLSVLTVDPASADAVKSGRGEQRKTERENAKETGSGAVFKQVTTVLTSFTENSRSFEQTFRRSKHLEGLRELLPLFEKGTPQYEELVAEIVTVTRALGSGADAPSPAAGSFPLKNVGSTLPSSDAGKEEDDKQIGTENDSEEAEEVAHGDGTERTDAESDGGAKTGKRTRVPSAKAVSAAQDNAKRAKPANKGEGGKTTENGGENGREDEVKGKGKMKAGEIRAFLQGFKGSDVRGCGSA